MRHITDPVTSDVAGNYTNQENHMAQRVLVQILDDLNGEEGAEPIAYSYGGYDYEIDLTEENQEAFFEAIRVYIEASRTTSKRKSRGKKHKLEVVTDTIDPAAIRAWAQQNGYEVSERGRIPRAIVDAYNQA